MQQRFTSLALAGTLGLAGLGAGVALAPALASAATNDSTAAAAAGDRLSVIKDVLAELVTDGTLTQPQADKVAATLDAKLPKQGGGKRFLEPALDTAAAALGIEKAELREQLRSGKSLADVAEGEGVSHDTLVSKLVAAAQGGLDKAVADGHLTKAQADARKADLESRITDMVNRVGPPPHRRHAPRDERGQGAQQSRTGTDTA